MAHVGPALPPHLLRQRQEEEKGNEEEQKTVAGEDDRKEEVAKEVVEEEEAPSAMVFGAALPPHLLEERRKREEEEERQKQEAAAAPPRRRVCGPSLDDLVAAPEEPKDEDEEKEVVEVLGPLRPDGMELPSSLVIFCATRMHHLNCMNHLTHSVACNGCTRTDPRARKPQPKRAALPSAPAYSLDPEERKQRTKRDIIEGRNKKGEPADKVPPPSPLSRQSPMPDADTRRRLSPFSPCVRVVTACRSKRQRPSPKWARTRSWRTTCSFTTYAPFALLLSSSAPSPSSSSSSAHPARRKTAGEASSRVSRVTARQERQRKEAREGTRLCPLQSHSPPSSST